MADIVKANVDILMISESQLNDFPDGQFLKERFGKPFHLNRNRNGGGIMFFFWSDRNPLESFYVKLNFRK